MKRVLKHVLCALIGHRYGSKVSSEPPKPDSPSKAGFVMEHWCRRCEETFTRDVITVEITASPGAAEKFEELVKKLKFKVEERDGQESGTQEKKS